MDTSMYPCINSLPHLHQAEAEELHLIRLKIVKGVNSMRPHALAALLPCGCCAFALQQIYEQCCTNMPKKQSNLLKQAQEPCCKLLDSHPPSQMLVLLLTSRYVQAFT